MRRVGMGFAKKGATLTLQARASIEASPATYYSAFSLLAGLIAVGLLVFAPSNSFGQVPSAESRDALGERSAGAPELSVKTELMAKQGDFTIPLSSSMSSNGPVRMVKELGHKTAVSASAWSPDEKFVATLSNFFRHVILWDIQSGMPVREFDIATGPPGSWSIAFTEDGRYIVTTADGNARHDTHAIVSLWRAETAELSRLVPGPAEDHSGSQNAADVFAVSPANQRLAAGRLSSRSDTVACYSGETWTTPKLISLDGDHPEALAFSPDGNKLLIGTIRGILYLFDLIDLKLLWRTRAYPEGSGGVRSVAYSPDGNLVASGFTALGTKRQPDGTWVPLKLENSLAIWDSRTGQHVASLGESTQKIEGISWRADGQVIAATQDDNTVRFWNSGDFSHPIASLNIPGPVSSIVFAPRGRRFVATGSKGAIVGEISQ